MKKIICILLGVLILAVYWKVQYHEFVNYDDGRYITENKHIKDFSKENFIWAFTQSHSANWHPVTWLSHMLDVQLYGLNPRGHHLTSLALHIANSLLLFLVFARMTGSIWRSCFVASLFAFHPINIESVAWASERKSVLSTFFWLLTTWTYINYVQKRNLARYSMVVLFFALGLMSKPMLVTLPFVFLLLDYWPLKRFEITNLKRIFSGGTQSQIENKKKLLNLIFEKIPLLLLVVGSCIVTIFAQKSWGAVVSIDIVPLATRISNALVSYLEYLGKMVWPKGFSVFYPYPVDASYMWKGLSSGFVITAISITILRLIKKAPYLFVGWFWYLGTLIPVIGLVQVGQQAMADRYAYVPLIGIFIIIAWGLPNLLQNYPFRKKLLSVLAGIFFSVLIILTSVQLQYWENSVKLFDHAIEVTEKKYPSFVGIYNNLGVVLNEQMKFEEARSHLKNAVKLQPAYSEAHNNLGNSLSGLNRFQEANISYREAIRLKPDYPEAHNNLANSLVKMLNFDDAVTHYLTAIRHKPEFAKAHFNLGTTFNLKEFKGNNNEVAIRHLEEAIRLEPNFSEAHLALGNVIIEKNDFNQGHLKTAIHHFKISTKIDPNNAIAHNSLGSAIAGQRNFKQAIEHFNTALKINPRYVEAHQNLGTAFSILGKTEKATYHFKVADDIRITSGSWFHAKKYIKTASTIDDLPNIPSDDEGYSFYIAGHTYGKSGVKPNGLYGPFTEKFHMINEYQSMKFGFLLGDVVNEASNEAWRLVKKDLDALDSRIRNIVVPGNHDVGIGEHSTKRDIFLQQFGKTFFSFEHEKDLFIILDANIDGWNISGEQLKFLKQSLPNEKDAINNIFIFSHQLIWMNNKPEFKKIKPNSLVGRSKNLNFWDKVFPLFSGLPNDIYFFSGDIGASPNRSELFYTKYSNVTFVATGMGGGVRDNFLIVSVTKDAVKISFVPLN